MNYQESQPANDDRKSKDSCQGQSLREAIINQVNNSTSNFSFLHLCFIDNVGL